MSKAGIAILAVMMLALSACFGPATENIKTDTLTYKGSTKPEDVANQAIINRGLDVKKLQFFNNQGKAFEYEVEVADTDLKRKIGLMNRTSLAANAGMLFVFPVQGQVNFWMKNTLIPLDMIFINANRQIVHIVENVQPCQVSDCPIVNSKADARYVVELNAGKAKEMGILPGDKVNWYQK